MTNVPPQPSYPGHPAGYSPVPGSPPPYPAGYGSPPGPPGHGTPPGNQRPGKLLIGLFACGGLFLTSVIILTAVAVLEESFPTTPTTRGYDDRYDRYRSSSTTRSTPSGVGTSKDRAAPVGTEITSADDWTVKVISADLDAGEAVAKEDKYSKPAAGHRYVLVTLTLRNTSDKAGQNPLDIGILAPTGVKLRRSYALVANRIEMSTQLQPGGTVTGRMLFEVPDADADESVLLVEPYYSANKNEDQRFMALE